MIDPAAEPVGDGEALRRIAHGRPPRIPGEQVAVRSRAASIEAAA